MNQEQLFFIKILSDHLTGNKTKVPDDIDWSQIAHLSRAHQVDGIIMQQCKDFMPEEYKESFESALGATLYSYANRLHAMEEIANAFRSANIKFFTVKGFLIAECYSKPALRTMGDCDIIVHRKDLSSSIKVMRELGYNGIVHENAHNWEGRRDSLLFEIHDQLIEDTEHANEIQKVFFNQYDSYVNEEVPEWNFHFLYLLMHLRKHFMNSGVGIRQFMDLAVIIKTVSLDWQWIQNKLNEMDLLQYARNCLYLCERWFGIKSPLGITNMEETFYIKITEKILRNGVFGANDKTNRENFSINTINEESGHLWLRRIKVLLRHAFPNYEYMLSYPGCGYLEKRKYLLVLAWAHRYILFYRRPNRSSVFQKIRSTFASREVLERQNDFLKKIGL